MFKRNLRTKFSTLGSSMFCILLLGIASCEKTPATPPHSNNPADSSAHALFICNEGNFNWGNASLSFYTPFNQNLQPDVYKQVNGAPLGDVLQSMEIIQNLAYLVLNNSGKIVCIDPNSFVQKGVINGFNSPRFILPITNNCAYVSDLYEKAVWIINPEEKSITGKINFPGWTEEMLLLNQKAYVCARNSNYVYVVNTQNHQITDSIQTGFGPQNIVLDQNKHIWVLTYGNSSETPKLLCINEAGSILKSFSFKLNETPGKLQINPAKNTLYWLNKDLFSMSVSDLQLPTQAWVAANGRNFYALGIHKATSEVLLSDAKDYVQRSEIFRYDSNATLMGSFLAGINTGYFYNRP